MESGMKITAGAGSADDYIVLAEMGADEIFCGFVPFEWNRKFGNKQPLNRREVLFCHVQIGSYNEMKILKKMQARYGVPIAVTFNALYYTEQQIESVLDIMKRLIEIGFSDFIVCDIALILAMKAANLECNLHISGEIGEWNKNTLETLKEVIMNSGTIRLKRIIFHRKNTIQDMESMIKWGKEIVPALEYEAFFLNEMCHFTGGFCNSLHCDEMIHLCQMPYKLTTVKRADNEKDVILQKWYKMQNEVIDAEMDENTVICETNEIPGESGCGFCILWKFAEIGVTHLKVVGRGKNISEMLTDVENVRKSIKILEESSSEEEYKNKMLEQIFKGKCSGNCYYRQI